MNNTENVAWTIARTEYVKINDLINKKSWSNSYFIVKIDDETHELSYAFIRPVFMMWKNKYYIVHEVTLSDDGKKLKLSVKKFNYIDQGTKIVSMNIFDGEDSKDIAYVNYFRIEPSEELSTEIIVNKKSFEEKEVFFFNKEYQKIVYRN